MFHIILLSTYKFTNNPFLSGFSLYIYVHVSQLSRTFLYAIHFTSFIIKIIFREGNK